MHKLMSVLGAMALVFAGSAMAVEQGEMRIGEQVQSQNQQQGDVVAMATHENKVFVLQGRTLLKIDLESLQQEAQASLGETAQQGKSFDSWFSQRDQNQDDRIAKDEIEEKKWEEMSAYDLDNNDQLSKDEIRTYYEINVQQAQMERPQDQQKAQQAQIHVTDQDVLVLAYGKLHKFGLDKLDTKGSVDLSNIGQQQGQQAQQQQQEGQQAQMPQDQEQERRSPDQQQQEGDQAQTEDESEFELGERPESPEQEQGWDY
jgi:hypothetical protein